jgi:squalene-associated FAD-dependent desaturase
VGGGLAGIAAALELADAGESVTLLEGRSRLGGATFSIERDGLWVDNGQHVFLRCCTAYRAFLERIGATSQTTLQRRLAIPVLRPGGRTAWLRRTGLPAPLHLGMSIARFGPLPARERLRLLPAIRALQRLSLDDPSLDESSFGDWLAEHGQDERALSVLWDLIALPTLNLRAKDASLALAAMVFKTGLLEDSGAADVGWANAPLQRLHGDAGARALADAGVQVHLRARVGALAGSTVAWDGGAIDASTVILAVPHDVAAELLPPDALPEGVEPERLGVSPIVNLHLVYDRPVLRHPFAAAVDSPVQWVFDRTASSGLRDGQYLAVSLSGADTYGESTADELRDQFVGALGELLPQTSSANVVSFFVTREPRATFRGVPGTAAHRPGPATNVPGLYLAGAWTRTGWPATMEGAIRSGLAAAHAALGGAHRDRERGAA